MAKTSGWHHATMKERHERRESLGLFWKHDNGSRIYQGRIDGVFVYLLTQPTEADRRFDLLRDAKDAVVS